jgi:FtsP/CotA-like multicopper oxidase with cupredoxin domain
MLFSRRQILSAAIVAPAVARADALAEGLRTLEAKPGLARMLPEPAAETPLRTFNGEFPGPIIRLRKGEEARVRLTNTLPQPIALHFQGVRNANAMDGATGLTQRPIASGETFDYRFMPPDAGTFWYRASGAGDVAEQVDRGLSGMLIVEEAIAPLCDVDMPIILKDWTLDDKGLISKDFASPSSPSDGAGRSTIWTVNAAPAPLTVEQRPGSRIRLRLLNASSNRFLAVNFDAVKPLVIAIDGQPCDPFEPARLTLPIGPGARFDVMFDLIGDLTAKAIVRLRGGGLKTEAGAEADKDLLVITTKGERRVDAGPIAGLPLNPLLPKEIKLQNAKRLDLKIDGPSKGPKPWTFNGGAGAVGGRPLFSVKRGQPVTLGFVNTTSVPHSVHVHGHVMRVLHLLDDGWEPYWRDSIVVLPGKTARVAFVADNPGKWLIESAILEYAAAGLSAWFEVA